MKGTWVYIIVLSRSFEGLGLSGLHDANSQEPNVEEHGKLLNCNGAVQGLRSRGSTPSCLESSKSNGEENHK